MLVRYLRNKQTGKTVKQYKQFDGVEYVFLPINDFWEVVAMKVADAIKTEDAREVNS